MLYLPSCNWFVNEHDSHLQRVSTDDCVSAFAIFSLSCFVDSFCKTACDSNVLFILFRNSWSLLVCLTDYFLCGVPVFISNELNN